MVRPTSSLEWTGHTPSWRWQAAVGLLVFAVVVSASLRSYGQSTARGRGPRPAQWIVLNFDATPGGAGAPEDEGFARLARTVRGLDNGQGGITLFLNAQFYMLPHGWRPPRGSPWEGQPLSYTRFLDPSTDDPRVISYARDPDMIEARIRNTRAMLSGPIELASHGTRHANGRGWSEARWTEEFDEYERYLREVVGIPPPVGFRAPFLAWNEAMHRAEARRGMRYDASPATDSSRCWPRRRPGTSLWVFGVPTIMVPSLGRTILSFDDSFRQRALDDDQVYEVYRQEFDRRYADGRAPMFIGSHGSYARSALRLARAVCRRADVRCSSYRELVEYLDAHPSLEGRCGRDVRLAEAPPVPPSR